MLFFRTARITPQTQSESGSRILEPEAQSREGSHEQNSNHGPLYPKPLRELKCRIIIPRLALDCGPNPPALHQLLAETNMKYGGP